MAVMIPVKGRRTIAPKQEDVDPVASSISSSEPGRAPPETIDGV